MAARASCFGKLPIYADFIRHNAGVPELESLDQWFQEGFTIARQTIGRGWDEEFAQSPPCRFLFVSPTTGRLTVGVLVPGVDRPGRKYPFLIFSLPEVSAFGREAVFAPLIFSDFLQLAQDMALTGWKGLDLRTYLAKVDALSTKGSLDAARRVYSDYLASKTAQDVWGAFGAFDDPRKYAIAQNLSTVVTPMRSGQSRLPTALRFPMAPGIESAMWLDLTLRFAGRSALPPLMLWSSSATTLLFNELNPKFFVPMIRPDRKTDAVSDLAKDGTETPGFAEKAKQRWTISLDDPTIPVKEMLRRLTGRDL
jgi:type VI secretion system ImpM family protein